MNSGRLKWDWLPEEEIVERLLTTTATTRSIADEYGCSDTTIKLILRTHTTKEERLETKNRKQRLSMVGRTNPHLKEWNESHKGITWTGRKHTDETKEKMSQVRRGSDNPHWKGGLNELVKGIRRSPEYHQWRKTVLERDNHTCRDCGATEGLDAHHIKSIFEHPELVFEVDNGLTLCKNCHKKHSLWWKLKPRKRRTSSTKR